MKVGSFVLIGVILLAPIFVKAQISIECLINEEITAPDCYDCTNASDTALFTGFRIIHSGVDTTMIEAPWRLKVRHSTNQFIFFDYRDEVKFSHIDSVDAFATLEDLITYVKDCQSFTVNYGSGDSLVTVHWQDTMYINYPEPGAGPTDSTYSWILVVQSNTAAQDTVTNLESVNVTSNSRIELVQSAGGFTINGLVDTCLHSLVAVTDSSFALHDCNDVPLDTVTLRFAGGGSVVLDPSRFVFTDPATGELTTNGTWGDSLLLYNGSTRYGQIDDKGNVSWGWLAAGSGNNNTRIGGRAGYRNQGDHNTYLGFQSGYLSLSDTHLRNTAIGYETAYEASGDDNLYMGQHSGWYNISDYSVYLGAESGYMTVSPSGSSDNNLAMGYQAARDAEGDNNVYLGNQSGYGTLGSNNIFIGAISTLVGSYSDRFALGGPSDFFMDGNMSTDSLIVNSTLTVRDVPALANPDSVYVLGPGHELNSYPISGLQTAPDSLEARGDSIAIIGSNAINLFDFLDTTAYLVDTDSQSLSLINDTLAISRGNSVALNDYRDTVKLKPFHEVWTNSDSTLTVNAEWDTLVSYNDSIRWKLLDNRIDAIALGKGARSDHYNSTALGARAFPYLQDTLVHPFNSTQVDTANEWIDGLGSFITHLNDLGYQTGDIVVIKWSLTSGEMPFIDTAQDLRVAEGIHAFTITSPSLLSPVQFGFDSVPTGAYTLQANQYLTGSTAIGHDAVVDKANQIALGDSTSQELKLGDSIRMKIDTAYTHFQLVGFDSTYNQLIPIDAAAFGFTPDADFWELEVDASPGSITDNTYTLGQTVFAADTSVNSYYVQVVPPNGDGINVRDPFSDDVDIMWSGTTYSWAWRLENDAFFLQDAGDPGVGTGVYISAINGYDGGAAILELQSDGGMQWSNYGIGSPRDGGSDFYAIPFVDGGGGVYQLRPDDFLDSLDLTDLGDSTGVIIPDREIAFGDGTRGLQSNSNLFLNSNNVVVETPRAIQTGNGATAGQASFITIGGRRAGDGSAYLDWHSTTGTYGTRAIRNSGPNGSFSFTHSGTGGIVFRNIDAADIEFETNSTDRLNILSTGEVGINQSSPSAQLHVDGTVRLDNLAAGGVSGVLYYDAENDIGKRSLANLQGDLGVPSVVPNTRIPFSNGSDYTSSSTFYYTSSQVHVPQLRIGSANKFAFIQSGNDLYIQPVTTDGIVFVRNQAGTNRFQIESDGDVKIFGDLDLDGAFIEGASDIGASNEYIKSNGSGGWTWTQPNFGHLTAVPAGLSDGDDDNQTLSFTNPNLSISGGNSVDLSALAGGSSEWTDGGGYLYPAGGAGDEVTVGRTDTPDGKFDVYGTAYFGASATVGDRLQATISDGSYAKIGLSTNSYILFRSDVSDDTEIYADGVKALDVTGTDMYVPASYNIYNATSNQEGLELTSTEANLRVNGSWVMRNTNDNTNIFNDLYVGQDEDDQLRIVASTDVTLYHETEPLSFLQLQGDGDVVLGAGESGRALSLYADANVVIQSTTSNVIVNDFLGVQNLSPGVALDVTGDIEYTGTITDVSDRRLKKNIHDIDDAYSKVLALRPVHFRMKSDGSHEYGYIAQEYQDIFPDQVKVTDPETGYLGIIQGSAEVYTTAAVQQLIEEVEVLRQEIKSLKSKIK